MARPQEGSFTWPGRDRAAEVERAAALAAERGLERLRERHRRRRPPAPPPAHQPLVPRAAPEETPEPAAESAAETQEEDARPADSEPPAGSNGDEPVAPDLWSAEFDRLAEELIEDLRCDLGPGPAPGN